MDTKELRRAYATLGLDERASLDDARIAYLTWVTLVSEAPASEARPEAEADAHATPAPGIDLIHHELDLAWHAIEQAYELGVFFPRQARGCQQCRAHPAVRITNHTVAPGQLRRRVLTDSAVLCREHGLAAVRDARRQCVRSGWWGLLGPISTLRALTRNSTELAFLRRMKPATPARARMEPTGAQGLAGHRLVGWAAGIIAVTLAVGIAVPIGSSEDADPGTGPTVARTIDGPAKS